MIKGHKKWISRTSRQVSQKKEEAAVRMQINLRKRVIDGYCIIIGNANNVQKVIVTGLEPATSRPVILRSTIDLHDRPINSAFWHPKPPNHPPPGLPLPKNPFII